jgi:allantoin racemase
MAPCAKKRILNIDPVVASSPEDAAWKKEMERHVAPGFELHHRNVEYGGMESIEGLYYMAVTVPYIVQEIVQAEREGYDAALICCFADVGVDEARELVNIPVVGAGEAGLYLALLLGSRLGVLTAGGTYRAPCHGAMLHLMRERVKIYGLSERVVCVRSIGLQVEDVAEPDLALEALYREGTKAIEDGAEALVLGCTGLVGYAEELQRRLDVPVVDPAVASLKFAETLIDMNLSHSRLTIPSPGLIGTKCVMKYPPTLKRC